MNIIIHCLTSLLPYESSTLLNNRDAKEKIITLLEKLSHIAIETLTSFSEYKFHLFDGHAGDTSCQVRASMISELHKKSDIKHIMLADMHKIKLFYDHLKKIKHRFQETKSQSSSYHPLLNQKEILSSFIESQKLHLTLNPKTLFLIKAYFLGKFSHRDGFSIPEYFDFKKAAKYLGCGVTLAKKMTRHLQCKITIDSCNHLIKLSMKHSSENNKKTLIKYDSEGRSIIQCFKGIKLILKNALNERTIIVIKSHRFDHLQNLINTASFAYIGSRVNGFYPLGHEQFSQLDNTPCITISGEQHHSNGNKFESILEYQENFDRLGLINIILANMATHPQFPGIPDEITNEHQKELEDYKKLAKKLGCSKEHPELFYLRHIQPDNLSNHINQQDFLHQEPYVTFAAWDKSPELIYQA